MICGLREAGHEKTLFCIKGGNGPAATSPLCLCIRICVRPNDPELVDLTKKFLAPCPEFPLGADNLGRCVLSRLLYGGRTTLGIVLVALLRFPFLGR